MLIIFHICIGEANEKKLVKDFIDLRIPLEQNVTLFTVPPLNGVLKKKYEEMKKEKVVDSMK